MAKRDEVFPSKFLKAADLRGKPMTLTIKSAPLEELKGWNGPERKTVLHFKETQKTLPLNHANWDSVNEVTGEDDTENWPGHKLEAYPDEVEVEGKPRDCIRIRAPLEPDFALKEPAEKTLPPPAKADEGFDDEIPWK